MSDTPITDYEMAVCGIVRHGVEFVETRIARALEREINKLKRSKRWIPITEQMPEDGLDVWITMGACVPFHDYVRYGHFTKHGDRVTHWMQIIPPPQ